MTQLQWMDGDPWSAVTGNFQAEVFSPTPGDHRNQWHIYYRGMRERSGHASSPQRAKEAAEAAIAIFASELRKEGKVP